MAVARITAANTPAKICTVADKSRRIKNCFHGLIVLLITDLEIVLMLITTSFRSHGPKL